MGKIITGMAMSLDGYIEDREGSVARLYPDFEGMRQSRMMQDFMRTTGAVVMGRHTYEMGQDYTDYEFQAPIFVLTHTPPTVVAKGENERLRFQFVAAPLEQVLETAKATAGDRHVMVVGGASIVQQCIRAGLFDELHVMLVPVLLGAGLRLFEQLPPMSLDFTTVGSYHSFTHLCFQRAS